MVSHTWVRMVAVVGTASLLLAACSGGKDEEKKAEGDDKSVTIASLLGAPDYENIDYNAQEQQIQEAVAKCMLEEGWEYIPVKYPDMNYDVEYSDEDELERIEREGLGVVYWTLNNGQELDEDDPWATFVDPNTEYVESLSEAEQVAYNASLYGSEEEMAAAEITEVDEDGNEYTYMEGNLGCQGEAYDAVYGDDPMSNPEIQEALSEYYEELTQRTEADPRLIKLNEDWAKCMKDAGFEYEDQNDFWESSYTEFQARADEVLGPDFYADPMADWTQEEIDEFMETATNEDWDELYSNQNQLTADQRTQLEEILADEIVLAKAQFTCSKDMNDESAEIYAEIEEQYALEHEDELKALAASVAVKE